MEQALLFLVHQHRREDGSADKSNSDAAPCSEVVGAAADAASSNSNTDQKLLTVDELFTLFPCLNAEVLHERTEAVRRPHAATKGAAPAGGSASAYTGQWTCDTCTFHNPASSNTCQMCMSPKPKQARDEEAAAAAESAARATHEGSDQDEEDEDEDDSVDAPWQCAVCTFINDSRAKAMCEICMAPNPRPLKAAGGAGGGGGAHGGADPFGSGFECPEGYWVCSVEHGGCSKFNPNSVFYCQVCEKARPNLASVRF